MRHSSFVSTATRSGEWLTHTRFVLLPGLRAASFVVRPITARDAERDYEAVIESRDYLHT